MQTEELERSFALLFFKFMGVSGWLVLTAIVVSSMCFAPSQYGGHDLLWLEWSLIVAIWLVSRWGTWAKDRIYGRHGGW